MECVTPTIPQLGSVWSEAPPALTAPIQKLFHAIENGLGYQYHANWGIVLQLLKLAFHVSIAALCITKSHEIFIYFILFDVYK